MSPNRRCARHRATVWMAYCPDCTTWHLAAEIARRDSPVQGSAVPGTDRGRARPGPVRLRVAA
ncbi:hypothetical protein [Geodermatophilus chilensis]|jgi:hypothetical protein|uniref:hypothetical protein n=1 Tax=Geodermatophilus chilensis TaxID=2035835 RepID=UPI000C26A453|nr:hypothetical protein [Geodermatophilus chilensis]